MTKQKTATHTPGPWRMETKARYVDSWYVHDSAGADLARVHGGYAESEANARLIAAAPALLESLTDLLNVIAADALIPASVSYIRQARKALELATCGDVKAASSS